MVIETELKCFPIYFWEVLQFTSGPFFSPSSLICPTFQREVFFFFAGLLFLSLPLLLLLYPLRRIQVLQVIFYSSVMPRDRTEQGMGKEWQCSWRKKFTGEIKWSYLMQHRKKRRRENKSWVCWSGEVELGPRVSQLRDSRRNRFESTEKRRTH